jgi:hypothetical protein
VPRRWVVAEALGFVVGAVVPCVVEDEGLVDAGAEVVLSAVVEQAVPTTKNAVAAANGTMRILVTNTPMVAVMQGQGHRCASCARSA